MSIEIRCKKCNKRLRVADSAAGKQGTCPGCGEKFIAPAAEPPRPPGSQAGAPPVAPPMGIPVGTPAPLGAPPIAIGSGDHAKLAASPARKASDHRHGATRKSNLPVIIGGAVVAFGGGLALAYFGWQWMSVPPPAVVAGVDPAATGQPAAPESGAPATNSTSAGQGNTVPATNPNVPATGTNPTTPPSTTTPSTTPSTSPPDPQSPTTTTPPSEGGPTTPTSPEPSPTPDPPPPDTTPPTTTPPTTPPENPTKTDPDPAPDPMPDPAPGDGQPEPPKNTPGGVKPGPKSPKNPPKNPPKTPKGKPNDEPEHAFGPDGVCLVCQGRLFAPLNPQRAYIHVEGEPAPKPDACVPWRFCPHCQKDRDAKDLVDAEAQRLLTAVDKHKDWEQRTQMQFVRVETRHATLHVGLAADVARRQGAALEALAAHLQMLTKSTLLTQTRPDTLDMLILPDNAAHQKFLALAPNFPEFSGISDWGLIQQTGGFNGNGVTVQNATKVPNLPPEHMTLALFSSRNIRLACGNKGRDWLNTGFQYYCEKAVTNQNRVHSINYQVGDAPVSQDWNADFKVLMQQRKLRSMEDLFTMELRFFTAPDHLESYSLVSYLIRSEPLKFIDFVRAVAGGQDDKTALESVFGKTLKELENGWGRFAIAQ